MAENLPTQGLLYRGPVLSFLRNRSRRAADFNLSMDRLELKPAELPAEVQELQTQFRTLVALLDLVEGKPGMSARDLADLSRQANEVASTWVRCSEITVRRIVEQTRPYDGISPYPIATEVWGRFDKSLHASGLSLLSRAKVQALMRRATDSGGLGPFLFPERYGLDAFALHGVAGTLARHTALPSLGEKTVWQAEDEATRDGHSPHLEEAIELWMAADPMSRAEARRILEGLWESYIQGRRDRGSKDPYAPYRNLVALMRAARRILIEDGDPERRRHAAKALLRLRCTFVLRDYYPEVKELILKGLGDRDGRVRRAVARFCESALWSLREETSLHDDLAESVERLGDRWGPAQPGPELSSPAKSIDQALDSYRRQAHRSGKSKPRPPFGGSGGILH